MQHLIGRHHDVADAVADALVSDLGAHRVRRHRLELCDRAVISPADQGDSVAVRQRDGSRVAAELVAGLPATRVAVEQHLDRVILDLLTLAVVDRHREAGDVCRNELRGADHGGDGIKRGGDDRLGSRVDRDAGLEAEEP